MKTILPADIKTQAGAKQLLKALHDNGESFHPEDDAEGINWTCSDPPNPDEQKHLNKLMGDIYDLPQSQAFDPCEYLLELESNFFLWKMRDGRGEKPTKLNAQHIIKHWDLSEKDDDSEQTLEDFIMTSEIGDRWQCGTDELENVGK